MSRHALYFPALMIAATGGAVAALGALSPAVGAFVQPVTYVAAGAASILFLRMLFDPRCRRGINAASQDMHGGQPFRAKAPKLNDPRWGLFGSRAGDQPLLFVRAVLLCEFVLSMPFAGVRPDLTLLAAASFGVTMMLTLLHAGLAPSAADPSVR